MSSQTITIWELLICVRHVLTSGTFLNRNLFTTLKAVFTELFFSFYNSLLLQTNVRHLQEPLQGPSHYQEPSQEACFFCSNCSMILVKTLSPGFPKLQNVFIVRHVLTTGTLVGIGVRNLFTTLVSVLIKYFFLGILYCYKYTLGMFHPREQLKPFHLCLFYVLELLKTMHRTFQEDVEACFYRRNG